MTDDQVRMNVAANLQVLLSKHGETPYRLAKELGEPLNTIYRIVRGDNVAGAGLLARIAAHFGVTVDQLLENPKKRRSPA